MQAADLTGAGLTSAWTGSPAARCEDAKQGGGGIGPGSWAS